MDFSELYEDTCSSVTVLARRGDHELLKNALDEGRAPNLRDNRGWQPLHHAVANAHIECVTLLLMADDVDVNGTSHEGLTPLMALCNKQLCNKSHELQVKIAKLLLQSGGNPNCEEEEPWKVPLNLAIGTNNLDLVKTLIDAGAGVNKGDYQQGFPIFAAAAQGYCDILKLLIDSGADMELKGVCDFNILHHLVTLAPTPDLLCLNLILNHSVCNKSFINARVEDGATALMLACQHCWIEGAEKLLEHGANANLHSDDGVLPLHLAIQFIKDTQVILEDIESQEDQDQPSINGPVFENKVVHELLSITDHNILTSKSNIVHSPYHLAVQYRSFGSLRELIMAGIPSDNFLQETYEAIVDSDDKGNVAAPLIIKIHTSLDTPLSFLLSISLTKQSIDTAIHMIQQTGCCVNALNTNCVPPLVEVVKHQRESFLDDSPGYKILDFLLDNGADPLYKVREEDILPVALHIASLFNPMALFIMIKRGLPVHKIFTAETFQQLQQYYIKSELYVNYEDFSWRVLSWLHMVTFFLRNPPHHLGMYFNTQEPQLINETNNDLQEAWHSFNQLTSSPKTLQELSILRIRETLIDIHGWSHLSRRLHQLAHSPSCHLPSVIFQRLSFENVKPANLIHDPPQKVMAYH